MALDVTSRSSLSTSEPTTLQSLMNGPINSGSIEHLLTNYSTQVQQQSTKSAVEDATLFLKAAAAAAAAAAAVSASENAASPCPTTSSLPESPKSNSPSFIQQHSSEADDTINMGRPGSISPPQPLALTGHNNGKLAQQQQTANNIRVKSPKSPSSAGSSPLEKLQSLSPNTITLSQNNHHIDNNSNSRTLKFSIDNILSPEFGKNDVGRSLFYSYYQQFQEKYSCFNIVKPTNNHSGNNHLHHQINNNNHNSTTTTTTSNQNSHHRKLSFDINTLVSNKRKRSDSESSSVSSLSNHSKDASSFQHLTNNNHNSNSNSASTTTTINNDKDDKSDGTTLEEKVKQPGLWPAWVYCTRYSDRPSSGPRSRKIKKKDKKADEKRPRTAFTAEQLARLKQEFNENKYLTEKRRQDLARELKLNESQIKIWFQNKRAKIKKSSPSRGPLALHLMAQGLYNHSTMPIDSDDEYDENYKASSPGLSESSKTG